MIETDDPKLTAFALNELPPDQYARVAESVVESPELQTEVAEIQQLGEELTALFSDEPCPTLDAAQRATILQAGQAMDAKWDSSWQKTAAIASRVGRAQADWLSRHRKLVSSIAALLLLAVTILFGVPWVVQLTAEPQYRASAWLRAEEIHGVYGGYNTGSANDPIDMNKIESQAKAKTNEEVFLPPISQLNIRVTSKIVEQELLKARTQALEEQINQQTIEIDPQTIEREVLAHPSMVQLEKEKEALERSQQQILSENGGNRKGPHYQSVIKELEELMQNRVDQITKLRDQIHDERLAAEKKRRNDIIQQAKKRIASNQLEIDLLLEKFYAQTDALTRILSKEEELIEKKKDLRREELVVELLASRMIRLRTEYQGPAPVTLLRKAEPPSEPISETLLSFWKFEKKPELTKEPLQPPSPNNRTSDIRDPHRSFRSDQVRLIQSRLVLEPVLNRPDVAAYKPLAESPEPLKWLAGRLRVQARGNSDLFIINFTCADPEYAAIIANAVVESYFRMLIQATAHPSTRVRDLLEDELARRVALIERLQKEVKELETKILGKNWDSQSPQD